MVPFGFALFIRYIILGYDIVQRGYSFIDLSLSMFLAEVRAP